MASNKEAALNGFLSGGKGRQTPAAALDGINAPGQDIIYYDIERLEDHPENITLFKPLSPGEFDRLKADIKKNGIHDALIVTPEKNGKRTVLAGHNRLVAAKELKLPSVPVREIDLEGKKQTEFIIRDNLHRRQLSGAEKIILLAKLYPDEMDSEDKGGRTGKGDTLSPLKTIPEIAAETGQSERSVQRAKSTHQETKKKTGKSKPDLRDYEKIISGKKPVIKSAAVEQEKKPKEIKYNTLLSYVKSQVDYEKDHLENNESGMSPTRKANHQGRLEAYQDILKRIEDKTK